MRFSRISNEPGSHFQENNFSFGPSLKTSTASFRNQESNHLSSIGKYYVGKGHKVSFKVPRIDIKGESEKIMNSIFQRQNEEDKGLYGSRVLYSGGKTREVEGKTWTSLMESHFEPRFMIRNSHFGSEIDSPHGDPRSGIMLSRKVGGKSISIFL